MNINVDNTVNETMITALDNIIFGYLNPNNEIAISRLMDSLADMQALNDEFYDALHDLDYALWGGPDATTLTEDNITDIKAFNKAFSEYDYKQAKKHVKNMPVTIAVSFREFLKTSRNFFN